MNDAQARSGLESLKVRLVGSILLAVVTEVHMCVLRRTS